MQLVICLFFSLTAFAQYSEQPNKESTADLRSTSTLFKIEDVTQNKTYLLERTPGLEYFLKRTSGKEEVIRKIDSREAKKLDQDFASRFLKCQYQLIDVAGECKVTLRLSMKGETQDICHKDDKKTQEVNTFVESISGRF
ncbi:MAG TPA: hypothetical protein VNJ01_14950 [Bacteriovoracaceae bacterium]|nr:hypothetical protein [Bacteriovoracaceae bacterium]